MRSTLPTRMKPKPFVRRMTSSAWSQGTSTRRIVTAPLTSSPAMMLRSLTSATRRSTSSMSTSLKSSEIRRPVYRLPSIRPPSARMSRAPSASIAAGGAAAFVTVGGRVALRQHRQRVGTRLPGEVEHDHRTHLVTTVGIMPSARSITTRTSGGVGLLESTDERDRARLRRSDARFGIGIHRGTGDLDHDGVGVGLDRREVGGAVRHDDHPLALRRDVELHAVDHLRRTRRPDRLGRRVRGRRSLGGFRRLGRIRRGRPRVRRGLGRHGLGGLVQVGVLRGRERAVVVRCGVGGDHLRVGGLQLGRRHRVRRVGGAGRVRGVRGVAVSAVSVSAVSAVRRSSWAGPTDRPRPVPPPRSLRPWHHCRPSRPWRRVPRSRSRPASPPEPRFRRPPAAGSRRRRSPPPRVRGQPMRHRQAPRSCPRRWTGARTHRATRPRPQRRPPRGPCPRADRCGSPRRWFHRRPRFVVCSMTLVMPRQIDDHAQRRSSITKCVGTLDLSVRLNSSMITPPSLVARRDGHMEDASPRTARRRRRRPRRWRSTRRSSSIASSAIISACAASGDSGHLGPRVELVDRRS